MGIFSRVTDEGSVGDTVIPYDPDGWQLITFSGIDGRGRLSMKIARSPLWVEMLGAEVDAEIWWDLPEIGEWQVPARVESIDDAPRFVPGDDALVTGVVEWVFEDSSAVDSLCYLEAFRFDDGAPEADSVWTLMRGLRKGRISRNKGTIAYLFLGGREFYGVNASLDDDLEFVDEERELAMRMFWHERLTPDFDYGRRDARYLTHAEAHALMRAFRQMGYLPPELTVFVDRETCRWCEWGLRELMEELGVRRLTVVQKGVQEALLLEVGTGQ
jgi:hypothetical protein